MIKIGGEIQTIGAVAVIILYLWFSIWSITDSRERMIKKNEILERIADALEKMKR